MEGRKEWRERRYAEEMRDEKICRGRERGSMQREQVSGGQNVGRYRC